MCKVTIEEKWGETRTLIKLEILFFVCVMGGSKRAFDIGDLVSCGYSVIAKWLYDASRLWGLVVRVLVAATSAAGTVCSEVGILRGAVTHFTTHIFFL